MSERIAVVGLWHLGLVTAAVMAEAGHDVTALDGNDIVDGLVRGDLPIAEPQLTELWKHQREAGRLRTTTRLEDVAEHRFIWVCYDTPLDADDRPDTGFVRGHIEKLIDALQGPATVAISSQTPVGFVSSLEAYAAQHARSTITFASIPENLRLGSAISYLRAPDRFVAGVRRESDRERIAAVLAPLGAPVVWMGVESAEMTKHALNAFLATSVVFANEIAAIAERVGADAREVEEGLKTDVRIGRRAYVRAGEAYAGGTLARDVCFLEAMGNDLGAAPLQVAATQASNERHKSWVDDRLADVFAGEQSPRVAILGLTYKPDTDTLRSSTAVALAHRLAANGARVVVYDPAIRTDAPEFSGVATRADTVAEALRDADAAVLMTPWPAFRDIPAMSWSGMRHRHLIDAQRFLEASAEPHVDRYVAFGRGQRKPG
jgi:UDPglucose 6-dehydrogenase